MTTRRHPKVSNQVILASLSLLAAGTFLPGVGLALAREIAQPGAIDATTSARVSKESVISSNGTARVSRAPDFVDVTLGVVSEDKSASAAQAAAMKAIQAATAAITGLRLSGSEVSTGSISLAPKFEDNPVDVQFRKIVGYQAEISMRIRTTDLQSPAKIIDAALASGCNQIESVQFGITSAIEAREEALKLATQAARRKARVVADGLEVRISHVQSASTSAGYFGGWYGRNTYQLAQMSSNVGSSSGPSSQDDQSGLVPGKIEIWAEANVSFIAYPAPSK